MAALGTVGYGLYAANKAKANKNRRIYQTRYSRSAEKTDQLWIQVAKHIMQGKNMIKCSTYFIKISKV